MSNRIVPDLQRVDRGQFTVAFLGDDVRLVVDVRDEPNAGDMFDGYDYPDEGAHWGLEDGGCCPCGGVACDGTCDSN